MIKLAISGAGGRMGQRLIALGSQDSSFEIVAALESSTHPLLGKDAGEVAGVGEIGVSLGDQASDGIESLIDFSLPAGADRAIDHCAKHSVPLVMATTGLEETTIQKIHDAAAKIPIVWAPSMSLAVNLTMKLAETAGLALKDHSTGVDVEIIERHHRFKADAPSGTALKFGEILASAMGITHHQHGREGETGQRPRNEIGYHAVRTGDDTGQHTILFGMLGETIELKVGSSNRDCYASGALAAAKFVATQKPGLYNMYDVLGL